MEAISVRPVDEKQVCPNPLVQVKNTIKAGSETLTGV